MELCVIVTLHVIEKTPPPFSSASLPSTEEPFMSPKSEEAMAYTPPPSIARLTLIELPVTVRVLCWRKAPPPYDALFLFTDVPSASTMVDDATALTPPPVPLAVLESMVLLETVRMHF